MYSIWIWWSSLWNVGCDKLRIKTFSSCREWPHDRVIWGIKWICMFLFESSVSNCPQNPTLSMQSVFPASLNTISVLRSLCEDCVCAAATVGAFRYGVINHRPSSDVNFFVNATVSSLSADWKIWEALFICTLLTPPSRGNGAGCVQAINATTKVVICHTPVIHNHYMECNAAKLPGLGWCCDSVCPRVSLVLFPHTQKKKYTSWTTISCNMFCFFFVLHLCLCLCKAICCLKNTFCKDT